MSFIYHNENPDGDKISDCVCRAITLATGDKYEDVTRKLKDIADLYDCDTLCLCCYHNLIDKYYEFPRLEGFKGFTIEEFKLHKFPGIYIIRVEGHLTCVIDGEIYDIWDCSKEIIDVIWIAAY